MRLSSPREWNFDHTKLLWTENLRSGRQITRVGGFAGVGREARQIPDPPAPGLFGRPIDMRRVRPAIERLRPASLSPAPIARPRVFAEARDRQSLPPVVISYFVLLEGQLRDLAALAGGRIVQPPL
jgi:hypothetical protein